MKELIDKREAIEALGERPNAWSDFEAGLLTQWESDVEAIKGVASAEPKWIPVSERLPEEEGEYLITDDSGGIKTIEVDSFMFFEDGTKDWCYSQNAIAWMPLPEPYAERRQDDNHKR